jgi:cob(I)alamin adenosyltransferase
MVTRLENEIDTLSEEIPMPTDFVVPGENQVSSALDIARTVIRRAERLAVTYALEDSLVVMYLNRLSDLAWTMARWAEGPDHRMTRSGN